MGRRMAANQHIVDYLSFYAGFQQPPRYAVMLHGRWGIGKTFLLKGFLERVRTNDFKAVYVSLNGLRSSDEIDKALFQAMHAVLGNKYLGAAVNLGKSGLKAWKGISVDVNLLDLVNRYTADLYVFDDLERCDMPIGQVLGYINAFVEHGERKVVIVANEDEIGDLPSYRRTREKLIGMTLVFGSAIDDALAAFLGSIGDRAARYFLSGKAELIRAVYGQAGLENLRILQQSLWDFERFYTAVEDRHRANDAAMVSLLHLLLALSMEVRAGRLSEVDLQDRRGALVRALISGESSPPSPFRSASARYPTLDLDSTMLSDESLVALLVRGLVDAAAIRRDLDASSFFVVVADEPAWRTVWHGLERTDAEVAAALAAMEAAFVARAYTVPGEVLHVFGLRLLLAQIGALGVGPAEVVAECERYVDDLYARGQLAAANPNGGVTEMRATGYGGLGIVSADTPGYRGLFDYLRAKQAVAATDSYPAVASALLDTLGTDPEEFMGRISNVRGRSGALARTPVLARIDPDAFVAVLASLAPVVQRQVLLSLKARYEYRGLTGELADERAWAMQVRERLTAAMGGMQPYGRFRMDLFLAQSLGEVPELVGEPTSTPGDGDTTGDGA